MHKFDQFIGVFDKVYSPQWCQEVIDVFDVCDQAGFTWNRQQMDRSQELEKSDKSLFFPDGIVNPRDGARPISPPLNMNAIGSHFQSFSKTFWECHNKYAEEYAILPTLETYNLNQVKIQKTKPGEGYHIWHCEHAATASSRIMAWILYLNDEFEAGETEFLYQQTRVKPETGRLVMWPASFTHTHRGNPPIGGTKYIATGWLEYSKF